MDNNQGKEVILKAENNKILKEKKNWILLLFKKLAKLIFNRIFYVAVAMLVQLGWILMMVLRLAAYSRYIDIGLRLIGIVPHHTRPSPHTRHTDAQDCPQDCSSHSD